MSKPSIKTDAKTVVRLYEKREKLKAQLRQADTEFLSTSRTFMDQLGHPVRCPDLYVVDSAKKVLARAQ
jgi:hypothetical protein